MAELADASDSKSDVLADVWVRVPLPPPNNILSKKGEKRMEKQAYVTLLSSADYVDAVAVLALSLQKVKSKHPLLVAITEDTVTVEIISFLKHFNCEIEIIKSLEYSPWVQENWKGHPVLKTASKIQIFNFVNWDKLIYIDADSVVLHNIDDLFNFYDGSMSYDEPEGMGFSGLFVFEPRNHNEFKYYPTLLVNHDVFDGNLIGELWFHVKTSPAHQIPYNYFWQYHPTFEVNPEIKAVHFCNLPKPWIEPTYKDFGDEFPIAKLYKRYLNEIQRMK